MTLLSSELTCLGIEELKEKREEVSRSIGKEEEEMEQLSNQIKILSEKLARLEDSVNKKKAARNEYDKTIKETETAYVKVCVQFRVDHQILESSQTLLQVLKRETGNLIKKRAVNVS